MTGARLTVAALAVLVAAAPAGAQKEQAARVVTSDLVVAVAAAGDVTRTVLIGPSGQVYDPDGAGKWVRRHAGGVAADVAGAARTVHGELVVAGRATPLYRRDGDVWYALRIGETGRTVLGGGPAPSVAVGKQVFVHGKGQGKHKKTGTWTRIGTLPAAPSRLWASGPKSVWAATDSTLYRLSGRAFTKAGAAPRLLAGGKTAWGIHDDRLRNLATDKSIPAELDGAAVEIVAAGAAPDDDALHVVVRTDAGRLVLARTGKTALARVDDVPAPRSSTAPGVVGLVVDASGHALVAFADGTIAFRTGDTWTTAQVEDDLPRTQQGPGPSRTR
jgi:hypothetical protein